MPKKKDPKARAAAAADDAPDILTSADDAGDTATPTTTMDKPPDPAPQPPPAEPRQLLKITAPQFIQARKIRWERAAGFLSWVRRTYGDHHRLTTKDWQPVWEGFLATPAGAPKR